MSIPPPLPSIGFYRQVQKQISQRQTMVPFFGGEVSLKTINDNPLYYSFMLSQDCSFDEAEIKFIESSFKKTEIVNCDICFNEEIDLDFVRHCRGCYHMSCIKDWLRINASCPRCHKECDAYEVKVNQVKVNHEQKEDN